MNDRLNLSVDLRRICIWILRGNDELVDSMLEKDMKMAKNLEVKIGRETIQSWLMMIKDRVGGRERTAERALTASVILS